LPIFCSGGSSCGQSIEYHLWPRRFHLPTSCPKEHEIGGDLLEIHCAHCHEILVEEPLEFTLLFGRCYACNAQLTVGFTDRAGLSVY
jgi:hypothetical protein